MSLKEVRNQLLISHEDGVINDGELLLLYDLNRSDNVDLPYNSYPGFDFDDLEDDAGVPFRVSLLQERLTISD